MYANVCLDILAQMEENFVSKLTSVARHRAKMEVVVLILRSLIYARVVMGLKEIIVRGTSTNVRLDLASMARV